MNELMGCSDIVPKKDQDQEGDKPEPLGRYDLDELLKYPSFFELVPGASQKISKKKKKVHTHKSVEKTSKKK